jgi:hypothetical protein
LFQTALKLHSQGPRFFDEASDAYNALFDCEVFRYPESKTEYERTESQADPNSTLESAFAPGLALSGNDVEGSGSSLPQALYLAYKNHGQFALDKIKHRYRESKPRNLSVFEEPEVLDDAQKALEDFAAALDRDPSDAELWRRTSRVAAFLKSARIGRYSLEAAVELDDDPTVVDVEPPSLAEGFAGEQLKKQLRILSDDMALSHPIMKPFLAHDLPVVLRRYLDPAPFLPDPTARVAIPRPSAPSEDVPRSRLEISLTTMSWEELGMALVRFFVDHGFSGEAISIQAPESLDDDDSNDQMEIDRQLQDPDTAVPDKAAEAEAPEDSASNAKEENTTAKEANPSPAENAPSPESSRKERKASFPSRKRSQSAAGLPDQAGEENGDMKRSKRIRRRDTAVEEAMDPATLLATQLQPFQAADQNLFQMTKNVLENLEVTDRLTMDRIAEVLDRCASEDRNYKLDYAAAQDLRQSIVSFNDDDAKILLNKKESPQLGLSTFLEHTKTASQRVVDTPMFDETLGLKSFLAHINAGWYTVHDVAYLWIRAIAQSYTKFKWSDLLKTAIVQVITRLDEAIYEQLTYDIQHGVDDNDLDQGIASPESTAHMLFELHIDIYERINNPNSMVESDTRVETRGRLERWLDVVTELTRRRSQETDELSLRFLWAAAFSATLIEGISRDHLLACWNSLRDYLATLECDPINLPNNAVISEISTKAAEREVSKLTTMDFFLGLFQEDQTDPVSVIDTLEPVLNPDTVFVERTADVKTADANSEEPAAEPAKEAIADCAGADLRDLWKFLRNSSIDLRLFLWTKLGDAYGEIKYTTKQFSCFLRGIEMIMTDLEGDAYLNQPQESRRTLFVTMLKALDDLLIQALSLALNDNTAFDIIDEKHLKTTSSALARLSSLLHIAAMFDDEVRIGMTQAPASGSTFTSFLNKIREMQVRAWSLQYTVLKVGIYQNKPIFPNPDNDLADYLAAVHQVLGLRKYCKASNKIFLKMMRVELLKQKNIENWEDYLGQVLHDLHGLKLGVGIWEVQDHGCPPEKLERKQAMALVEKITVLANRMPIKDLLKSDLKNTIDHIQQAIGTTKSTPQMIHNLRNFTEYLKKPIHPLRLYQALSGNVTLDAVNVNTAESALAKQGWFFLLGMIALTKFKGVDLNRRQTPGATDDLRIGATFLRLQLQFTPDRWDAWFRLAECFDYELDEAVLWTADKINKDRGELVKFQRNSIHCYTLALSNSVSWVADSSSTSNAEDDEEALIELYHKFAMRLYASSREPFAMDPFKHSEHERFFIENLGAIGTYKKIMHDQISDYKIWKYAAGLFRRAMVGKPKDWKNPYMLAKCLWKMYQKPRAELDCKDSISQPTMETVIKALEKAVEVVSALPKPRHGQDPILEPHYKILSVVHKLIVRGNLSVQEGANILQRQPYAVPGEDTPMEDAEDWEAYVIKSLRFLRDKDKSNWQHRLIIRHARILFENEDTTGPDGTTTSSGSYVSAKAAFMVLRESMFTKTMVMNVWKCDAERPGRHHVYTEQYVRFMLKLLAVMNDRLNMEALLRRIRKKGADFYHFNDLWQSCVLAYVRLLRQSYHIPLTEEDAFKTMSPEDFDSVAEKVNDWVNTPEAQDHPGLGAMKDAIELKKLNASLMKAAPIDDLINDCYTYIYLDVGPEVLGPELSKTANNKPVKVEAGADNMQLDGAFDSKPLAADNLAVPAGNDKESMVLGSLRAGSEQPEKMERQVSSTGDVAPKARKVGIRRPDVLRKAEQAVLRAVEGPPKSAGANGTSSKSRLGSASSGKNNTPNGEADDKNSDNGDDTAAAGDEDVEMKDANANGDEGDGGNEASSPGSVHDSADDESDLSDVPADYEDDVPPSLLFPNLRRSVETGAAVGEESEGESAAEEENSSAGEELSSPPPEASSPPAES